MKKMVCIYHVESVSMFQTQADEQFQFFYDHLPNEGDYIAIVCRGDKITTGKAYLYFDGKRFSSPNDLTCVGECFTRV